MNQYNIH